MNFKKFFKILLFTIITRTVIVAGFSIYNILSISGSGEISETSENGDINVLFMATDKGGFLTDTIMLASISNKSEMVNILSIPRDTKVNINGRTAKINSAYGRGKEGERINLPINLVEEITGLDVNYYAVVHPNAIVEIVDTLGGVEIDVPSRMYYVDPVQDLYIDLYPGLQVLDGAKAEQFLRFRSGYANADLGRIEAQQMFLKEFIKQKLKLRYLSKAKSLYNALIENIDTNISLTDTLKFAKLATNFNDYQINTYQLPGVGGSYFIHNQTQTDELINKVFINHIVENSENSDVIE